MRLSTDAYALLHDLAMREQLTLSETIERHLATVAATLSLQGTPPVTEQAPAKQTTDSTAPMQVVPAATAPRKQGSAFITTRKGVCYLTIKNGQDQLPDHAEIQLYD